MVKPGTVLIVVFIAVLGFFVYSWSADSITNTGDKTLQEQQNVIDCSKLDIEIMDFSPQDNVTKVSFSSNQETENVSAVFVGENNVTAEFDRLQPRSMETARASGTGYSNVYIEVQGCGRVASYR